MQRDVFSWAGLCFFFKDNRPILCFVSETKGQDQPEDENAAKARPELE